MVFFLGVFSNMLLIKKKMQQSRQKRETERRGAGKAGVCVQSELAGVGVCLTKTAKEKDK